MSTEAALKRMEEKIDRIQQDVEFIKEDHGKKLGSHEDRFDRLEGAVVTNREMIAENREMIAENREMIAENQEKIDQVHQAVVLLEKVHNDKLDAVMDGYDIVSNRDYRLEQRLDMTRMCIDDFEQNFIRLETGQQEIKTDVSEIKHNVEKLVSIVSDHEGRLQILERKGKS